MKEQWRYLINKRNGKLADSDWTQFVDSPLSDVKKAEWVTYRQALRDIPNTLRSHSDYVSDTETNPFDGSLGSWSWPTKPS